MNFTVMRSNVEELPAMMRLAQELGCSSTSTWPPTGRSCSATAR